MSRSLIIVSVLTFWVLMGDGIFTTETDYCSPKLCSSGQRHIACNNTGTFSPTCPENQTEMVNMTEQLKEIILQSHNSKRNLLASGNLQGFQPAVKMSCMQWDDELAYMAALNTMTCKFGHDACRSTPKYKSSGQNLAKMWWKGGSYTDQEIILNQINNWWLEYKNTNMSQVQAYPRYTEKMIGHFTVMTAEKNRRLGCAAIKLPDDDFSSLTLACNYAATNFIGMAMYTVGPPASKCANGTSLEYTSLCL